MSLVEKLSTINRPRIESFQNGTAETIKEFYESFIEPRLPQNIEHVIKWHKVLKEYVKKENNVLGFRAGNVRGSLRRGWETITNDNYSFFYTDNFFAHYFFKLALDADWEPNLDEFYNAMRSKDFPVRFAYFMGTEDDPYEKEYASFNVNGKNPGLNTAGYKLAHIIDAGKNYLINGQIYGLTELIEKYFELGTPEDWSQDPVTHKYCRKNFVISEETKALARNIAEVSFLRMVHPMNYFLSPKTAYKGYIFNKYTINGVEKKNIAEDELLISYVRQRFHERYTVGGVDYFQDFLDLVYPVEDKINENGNTVINIKYSSAPMSEKKQKKEKKPITTKANKSANRMSKNEAIALFRQQGYTNLNNSNTTFSSQNSNNDRYWANPNIALLNSDWWLILNDIDNSRLSLFHIPAQTITEDLVVVRADNQNLMDIQINYDDNEFTDSRSDIPFATWLETSIDY